MKKHLFLKSLLVAIGLLVTSLTTQTWATDPTRIYVAVGANHTHYGGDCRKFYSYIKTGGNRWELKELTQTAYTFNGKTVYTCEHYFDDGGYNNWQFFVKYNNEATDEFKKLEWYAGSWKTDLHAGEVWDLTGTSNTDADKSEDHWKTAVWDEAYTIYFVNVYDWPGSVKAHAYTGYCDYNAAGYGTVMTSTGMKYNNHDIYRITLSKGWQNVMFSASDNDSYRAGYADDVYCYANAGKMFVPGTGWIDPTATSGYTFANGATVVWDNGSRSDVLGEVHMYYEDWEGDHDIQLTPIGSTKQHYYTSSKEIKGKNWIMRGAAAWGYGQTTDITENISNITLFQYDGSADSNSKINWQVTHNAKKATSGTRIYFDNTDAKWSKIWLRYGTQWYSRCSATSADKVSGTENLYVLTIPNDAYYAKYLLADNCGYTEYHNIESAGGDGYLIGNRTAFIEGNLSSDITYIPSSGNGGTPNVWAATTMSGHTHRVTISAPSNGTITVGYTNESGSSASFNSGYVDVARTCTLTISADPADGYDNPETVSVNAGSITNGGNYTIREDITVSATFNPHTYSITLNAGDHGAANGSATVVFNKSALATSSLVSANAGYEVEGYYNGETKVLNADGSFAAADVDGYITDGKWSKYDADATLTAKFNTVTLHFTDGVYWDQASNWEPACVPTIDHDVVVEKRCIIRYNNAQAKSVKIDHYREYGPNLDIQGNYSNAGALLVKEGISAKHAEEGDYEATDDLDLYLEIGQGKNAALICGNASDNTKASCIFHSKIYRNGTYYINQYVGVPFSDMDPFQWYGVYIFEYDAEHDNWKTPAGEYAYLKPYTAYDIISKNSDFTYTDFYMNGTLILPGITGDGRLHTYNCDWRETSPGSIDKVDGHQDFLFANSWLAPISIKDIKPADYNNLVSTIYIFNAGYIPESGDEKVIGDLSGQWSSIPFGSAAYMTDNKVIPAGQAFLVTATASGASLTLDYNKHVYDPAATAGTINTSPTRAPKRVMEEDAPIRLKMAVRNNDNEVNADVLYLFERGDFSTDYDEGWDGYKVMGEAYAPQLYVENGDAQYAVDATPELDNTSIGFKAGTIANEYTFVFEYDDDEPLYLYDKETQDFTRISNEATYTFQTKDNAEHSRFALTRSNAPQVVTAFENAEYETEIRAEKFIENSMLFIRRGDKVYSIDGTQVK